MAPQQQPFSLLALSHRQVAKNLANICRILHTLSQETCVTHVLNITKNSLRPVWQSSVPASIRAQLLEETTSLLSLQSSDSAASITGAAPLYLLVLLLAKDIKKIRIELCCYYGCSHQTALLKFLAHEGKGLTSLELARSTLLRLDRTLLQSVLLSASFLQHLTFKNIANDSVLQIIGANCPNLISLDVSHSKEVTDIGLQQLFLRIEIHDKLEKSSKKLNLYHTNLRHKFKLHVRHIIRFIKRLCPSYKGGDTSTKDLVTILEYCELRNDLCSTLKYLNIANTGITNAGILSAILHVSDLESLGDYCHVGRALELLEQTMKINDIRNHHFKLKNINSSRTTQHRLELICKCFPKLRRLKITEPLYLPKSLFILPSTIISLNLQSIPSTDQWLHNIYEFLNGSHGQILEELSLRFFPGDILPFIDLNKFLYNCSNLRALNLDGANINWKSDDCVPSMNHLYKVQLGKVVTMSTICKILEFSPALQILHIYSCNEIKIENVFNVKENVNLTLSTSKLSQIECFYMYETSNLTKVTLQALISTLPNIKRIGNIRNCGLKSEEIQLLDTWIIQHNFNTELFAGSHWFSSCCFPL